MTKYSKDSTYNKYANPAEQLTSDKITNLGNKKDYPHIAMMLLLSIVVLIILAVVYGGLAMAVVGTFCVFGINLPFAPIVSISSIIGSIATFIWLKKGWGEHFA